MNTPMGVQIATALDWLEEGWVAEFGDVVCRLVGKELHKALWNRCTCQAIYGQTRVKTCKYAAKPGAFLPSGRAN